MDLEVETLKQLLEFIYTGEVYSHYEILKCSMMNRFQFFKPTYQFDLTKHTMSQVANADYSAELLYAGDKYELSRLVSELSTFTRVLNLKFFFTNKYTFPQVQLCARQFKAEISPDTAADTFLLADRHGLGELKQVG